MLFIVRLLVSFFTAYFFGRVIYCSFCNPKDKNNIISKFHSFYLGLGFTSIVFWFYTVLTNGYNANYHIVEICLVEFTYLYLFFRQLNNKNNTFSHHLMKVCIEKNTNIILLKKELFSKKSVLGYISSVILFLIALLYLLRCLRHPDGAWDAVAMWNIKAKFLACGNESWSGIFSDYYDYIHRDYPLFLPCSIARIYNYIHYNITLTPMFLSFLFSFSCFLLPYLFLIKLKNKFYAIFAVCLLSFSHNIFYESSKQYADMPLAVFELISLYEIIIWDMKSNKLPWLCVLFSSLCFWIKNEGIPWFIMYCLLILFFLYKKDKKNIISAIKKFFKILIVALPIIISVISVRYLANNENDIVSGIFRRLGQIFYLERYKIIFPFIWTFIQTHFWIIIIPIYLLFGFIDKKYNYYKVLLLLILFMYSCYIFIYLITPHDLKWHLETSFPRIATVFLPSLIFLGCLLIDLKRDK